MGTVNNQPSIFSGPNELGTANNQPSLKSEERRLSTPEYEALANAGLPAQSPSFADPGDTRVWNGHSQQTSTSPKAPRTGTADINVSVLAGRKRSIGAIDFASQQEPQHSRAEPLHKRRRVLHIHRHTLDRFDFSPTFYTDPQPPSPLFFSSNTARTRPQLPPRFSSGEAGARMLSKAHAEESSIKTVTLARGSYSGSSPPGVSGSSGRTSSERGSLPRISSPETNDQSRILSQVGVLELLEQDGRPSFVIDLADTSNYRPGPFRIVFANSALRSNPILYEAVLGKNADSSPRSEPPAKEAGLKGFPQFKAWLLSVSNNGESLDVCLPAFIHGGVSWSCSTLRRRLRVASASAVLSHPSSHGSELPSASSIPLRSLHESNPPSSIQAVLEEPADYFGNATLPIADDISLDAIAVPSIEPSPSLKHDSSLANGLQTRLNNDLNKSLDQDPSIINECVLGAIAAGEVDAFDSMPREIGFFDWTRLPLSDNLPRHIQFARSVDWSSTALGPIEFWPTDLRQMCNLIMASPHPAAMYWGDDLVAIYNEAYVLLAGQKHPRLMGQSYRDAWAEIWDEVKDVFANARSTGQATMKDDDCLFIKRSNYLEETYFSWSIIPIVGSNGTVTGLYNPAFEKTRRKIAERRMLTLREVGERTATARDVKGFWEQVSQALDSNEFDTPFVLLYSVNEESDSDSSSIHSSSLIGSKQCNLEGSLGVPTGHPAAPAQMELKSCMEGFAPVFREVMKMDKPVLLRVADSEDAFDPNSNSSVIPSLSHEDSNTIIGPDLEPSMLEGIEWRGFQDPCQSIVVCPVHPTTGELILGFLVLGVNPRRPFDADYSLFVQLLSRQLATSLASVVLFEEEIRRGQRAAKLAALDRIELSQQLAARTQEARDSETRFTRMAEFSPAGLFIADAEGHITYCNDTYYEITRAPRDVISTDRWIDAVKEEDQQRVRDLWRHVTLDTKPITAEFRFKAQWEDRTGNRTDTWVLFSAYPEKSHPDGNLKSVFGSITDISQQKWAEDFQKRKMEEAVELKRQQENFIDITSHEMRNPLSAILQCADEISSTLQEARDGGLQVDEELMANSIDAAQTIALCALHQKRIVDDVLTLSKLDSQVLIVTPVDVQPLMVVQRALKMFENEIQSADIDMRFVVDKSYKDLGIDWIKADPQRILQVLINLTTNAIKFTTSEAKRDIIVSLAAYKERPSQIATKLVDFFPSRRKIGDMTAVHSEWGKGEVVYVQFAVQDTGRGLAAEEKKLLFIRFSQASPRTHVQYGGSGLGLFISRELTELQGGEIGVASEAGRGSTFAFYVEARRSTEPSDNQVQYPALLKQNSTDKPRRQESIIKTMDFATVDSKKVVEERAKKGIKVLVVEDNLVNQRVLQKQLKHLGFIVYVANHGDECLDRLRESNWWKENHVPTMASSQNLDLSVVLMDQEMPVMDGLAATKRIREWEQEGALVNHVPIIAVTANARQEQINALLNAGMDDVVSKPFRIPELVPKIEELFTKYSTSGKSEAAAKIDNSATSGKKS